MPTLTFPTLSRGPAALAWSMQAATLEHRSPLSGSSRTISTPGTRWAFSATWPNLARADRLLVEAFLTSLNGRAGRFYYWHPNYYYPRGTARTGFVNGAGQSGTSLNVVLTANATLLAGDFFEVNGELKRMTSSVTATAGGNATLLFGPPLRNSPGNGVTVTLTTPKATFMLMDDRAGLTLNAGGFADFSIDATETFL